MIRARVVGLPEILADLGRVAGIFDLDRNGLATMVMDLATTEILASMDAEQTPEGLPWPELSQAYLEYKLEIAPQAPMAVLHGIMKTWEQVAGDVPGGGQDRPGSGVVLLNRLVKPPGREPPGPASGPGGSPGPSTQMRIRP